MKRAVQIMVAVYVVLGLLALAAWLIWPEVRSAVSGSGSFAFRYPWVLLALVPIPALAVLAVTRPSRGRIATMTFTRTDLVGNFPRTWRMRLAGLPHLLRAAGLAALVLALARPEVPHSERLRAEGIDIYVVLDMSGSMQAIDLSESELRRLSMQNVRIQNRFDVAQTVLREFVLRRKQNPFFDRIGMVIFARHAFLQFPLTIDYDTVLWLLDRLELNAIDPSQTAIGNALGRAVLGLIDRETQARIVILITDGDERGGNLSALQAAQVAADEGIQVFPILVGREGAALVPADRSHFGFGQTYVQREYPVDPELLQQVAELTDGQFFRAYNREGLETTLESIIGSYETDAHEQIIKHFRTDVFFWFAVAGFLLLALDLSLRYSWLRKFP